MLTAREHLEKTKCRWYDNIKMYLKGTGIKSEGWIHLAQDRYHWRPPAIAVMNLRVIFKGGEFLDWL
jgi:hypothetical protein